MDDLRSTRAVGGVVAIVAAAVCMRSALTAVGPVLHLIGDDTGLSNTLLGLLTALPLLAFAAVSPLVSRPVRRIGIERTVVFALAALALGTLVRSVPGAPLLWLGTAVIGAGIAVCNVLIPVVVRRDHPGRVALMTGLYSGTMGTAAAIASGVSLPLSRLPGSWRWSLGVWAVLSAAAVLVWARRPTQPEPAPVASTPDDGRPVWRTGAAWRLTAVMGLQSTTFYILVAWLPSITTSEGASDALSGWYLFAYQVLGIAAGFAVPTVLHRAGTPLTGVVVTLPLIAGCLGILLLPAAMPLWIVLAGTSSGASLVYALTRISLAARDSGHATRLSGMAQSLGYLLAAGGPIAAGWLRDRTGSWTPALILVGALAVAQATAAVAGRRKSSPPMSRTPVVAPTRGTRSEEES